MSEVRRQWADLCLGPDGVSQTTCHDTERMRAIYLVESAYHILIWAAGALPAEHGLPRINQQFKNTKQSAPKGNERNLHHSNYQLTL